TAFVSISWVMNLLDMLGMCGYCVCYAMIFPIIGFIVKTIWSGFFGPHILSTIHPIILISVPRLETVGLLFFINLYFMCGLWQLVFHQKCWSYAWVLKHFGSFSCIPFLFLN